MLPHLESNTSLTLNVTASCVAIIIAKCTQISISSNILNASIILFPMACILHRRGNNVGFRLDPIKLHVSLQKQEDIPI